VDQLVELEVLESIGTECVRQTPKNELQPWRKKQWVIPPQVDAEFVCQMADVLEVYQRDYDPKQPVVYLDETSKQLVAETRIPVPAAPGRPARVDYEYERKGTANLFLITDPLVGQRWVEVTERRTAKDFAAVIRDLVDKRYPEAEKIVLDNLNTIARPRCMRRLRRRRRDGYWIFRRSIIRSNMVAG
jgi:hypothetical protein